MTALLDLPVAEILARYPGESAKAIGKSYGCCKSPVLRILREHGVAVLSPQRRSRSLPDETIISRYLDGETAKEISANFNCSEWTIKQRLQLAGVVLRRTGPRREYTLNEDFFHRIRTEAQAYWLGFILADGSVVEHGDGQLVMRCALAVVDAFHLYKLAIAVETDSPITLCCENTQAYIDLCSAQLCRDLIELECFPNKTGKHGTPRIRQDLLRHFYRGYVDGDGSLYPTPTTHAWRYDVVGSPRFIREHQRWLMQRADVGKTKLVHRPPVCSVRYTGGTQIERIARLLYEDATVYLDRKHAAYLQLLARRKQLGRRRCLAA